MRILAVALALSVVTPSAVRAISYAERVIADGAIHYWRFEEVSTLSPAVDEIPSGNGQINNPGSYQGGITPSLPSAFPALDNAVHFGGQDSTHVALGVPQHPGASMTIEAWVNLDVAAPGTFIPIATRWDGSWEVDVNVITGKVNMVVRNNVNSFGSAESHAFTRGEWHHVVGIFHGDSDGGGGTVTIYLDGVPGTSQTIGLDLQDAGGDDGTWYIGRSRNPTSGLAWTGAIDEVAIYPYALTEEQIRDHIGLAMGISYSQAVIDDSAIHYWRFEEVSTLSPAVDEIPSGNGQVNNPGLYEGGVTLAVASADVGLGTAAHFDGQNGTHVALGVPQHPGASMTIEAWVNLDVAAPGTFIPIATRWDGSWELDVNVSTGKANMVVRNNANGFGSAESHVFTRGEWHHLVGIFDAQSDGGSGSVTIYLDGVPGTSQTIGLDLQDAGGDDGMWYIGRSRNPTSGLAWTGAIDEVSIYSYALTHVQVVQHFLLSPFADAITSVRPLPPPQGLTLHPAVPNPFNPSTTITFLLPHRMNASLIVFDVTGRRVRTLADGMMPAGLNRFSWNGRDDRGSKASSGVYWFRLHAGELTAARSAVLLK